ncbi:MAG: response regulator [Candidatus Hydrogenedentes bacterium]|nr:response regulator [Candidatus Hydrogenedentota bacterium]
MRILFADDDNSQLEILKKWSVLKGYDARFATNGREVLEIYNAEGFDLAVLDIDMPEIDGITVAEELTKINPEMKIIILTGLLPNLETSLPSGIRKVLIKPVSLSKLSEEISNLAQ